jgi:hypothetical protein
MAFVDFDWRRMLWIHCQTDTLRQIESDEVGSNYYSKASDHYSTSATTFVRESERVQYMSGLSAKAKRSCTESFLREVHLPNQDFSSRRTRHLPSVRRGVSRVEIMERPKCPAYCKSCSRELEPLKEDGGDLRAYFGLNLYSIN